jgi:MFS family permease
MQNAMGQTNGREFRRGWPIILAAALGVGAGTTGLPFYTFGIFIAPLSAEFGWSRGEIALGSLFLTTGTFVLAPFVGQAADRFGARSIGIMSLGLLAAALVALPLVVTSRLTWYGAWLFVAIMGSGTAAMVWTKVVALWFTRMRGLALGLTLIGTGLAGAIGPIFVNGLIAQYGWRAGFFGMAAVVGLGVLPLVALLFRPPPQLSATTAESTKDQPVRGLLLNQAWGQVAFWRIGIGFFAVSLGIAATIVHLVPLLIDRGLSPATAAAIAGGLGLSVIAGRLSCGFLVDRIDPPRVAGVLLTLPAIGSLLLAYGSEDLYVAIPAALMIGLAAGAEVDLVAFLTGRHFGLKAFGAILGCELAMFGAGAALGPPIMGLLRDLTGNYQAGLTLYAGTYILGAALIAGLGKAPDFAMVEADPNFQIEP